MWRSSRAKWTRWRRSFGARSEGEDSPWRRHASGAKSLSPPRGSVAACAFAREAIADAHRQQAPARHGIGDLGPVVQSVEDPMQQGFWQGGTVVREQGADYLGIARLAERLRHPGRQSIALGDREPVSTRALARDLDQVVIIEQRRRPEYRPGHLRLVAC